MHDYGAEKQELEPSNDASGFQDGKRSQRGRITRIVKELIGGVEVSPEEENRFVDRVLDFIDRFGTSSTSRRNFIKLTTIGGSVLVFHVVSSSSCQAVEKVSSFVSDKFAKVPDVLKNPSFTASVLRKADLLALRFDFYNLKLDGDSLVRKDSKKDVFMVVSLAYGNDSCPQNIGEKAYLETDESINGSEDPQNAPTSPGGAETPDQPGYVGALLAGPSRLAFKIQYSNPISFTLEELLAWYKHEMNVVATAQPPEQTAAKSSGITTAITTVSNIQGQLPVEPSATETAIEVPWQLILSPSNRAGWAHATQPVTRNNRTELWHTRLGVRIQDSEHPGQYLVDEQQEFYRTLRAVWAQGFNRQTIPDANDLTPFRMSLTKNDRWQLVRLTSDYGIQIPAILPQYYRPTPIQVNRFMLSALGAWMNTRGEWPNAPASADLDILEWKHIATMARDHYVRVVYKGFMFPTGHAATLVKITERKFQGVPSGGTLAGQPAAYLRQRFFIIVRQPIKEYPAHTSQPLGGREWPFETVRITTLVTPTLDNPGNPSHDLVDKGQKAFWPRVGDQDFLFHLVGVDTDGQSTEFTCPLAFISTTLQQSDDVSTFLEPAITTYNTASGNKSRRERPLQGQKVAFAPSTRTDGVSGGKPGDTSVEVKLLTLGAALPTPSGIALPDDQPRFFPTWQEAEVRLPSAEQASGKALPGPVVIQLHPDFKSKGFNPSSNPGYIWAKLKDKVDLSFNGGGEKSGAVVTPNLQIGGLSRTIGVVGGTVNATPTVFDPASFFSDAKILGGLLLADIIKSANFGDGRKTPSLTNVVIYPNGDNTMPPQAVETRLDWKPDVEADPLNIFEPSASTILEVKGTFITPLDPPAEPTYNITGDLRGFWVNMLGKDLLFLRLHFNKVVFIAETGKKPNVDVDIDQCEFAGVLEFVNKLKDYLKTLGSGLSIDITPTQVSAGFSLPIPSVTVGVMSLQNMSLGVKLVVPFTGNPARVRFNFCEREQPFLLTIFAIGGGGFFAIEIGLDGVERLEAALEFGASMALDIGVASGEVHIMGGIYFEMEKVGQPEETVALTSYIRMGGSLEILGIITLSIEFYLGMTFQKPPNELWGQATLTVKIEILFFSASVELSVERRLAGGEGGGASSTSSNGRASAIPLRGAVDSPLKLGQLATTPSGGNFEDLISLTDWTEYTKAFVSVPI